MTIERYVRCSVDVSGGSVEAGVEYRAAEATGEIRRLLRKLIEVAAGDGPLTEQRVDMITRSLEMAMSCAFQGRAWFVEIWNAHEALTQVYAPYGMPRHQSSPTPATG